MILQWQGACLMIALLRAPLWTPKSYEFIPISATTCMYPLSALEKHLRLRGLLLITFYIYYEAQKCKSYFSNIKYTCTPNQYWSDMFYKMCIYVACLTMIHNWFIKGCGMFSPVCGIHVVHMGNSTTQGTWRKKINFIF